MYIPPGFSTVTPHFFVTGAEQFVGFLVDGLGGVREAHGNLWWISQLLVEEPHQP